MEGGEVGEDVFPAAVVVDGAGGVEGSSGLLVGVDFQGHFSKASLLGFIVETADVVPVVSVVVELTIAPALVHQRPGHDARMIDISFDRFGPLLVESCGHLTIILIAAGHLAPYTKSQAVSPVVEARILNLLMLAAPVEAHRFGELDVVFECSGRRWCHQRRWPIALVEQ